MTLIGKHALRPHPVALPERIRGVEVEVRSVADRLMLSYSTQGDGALLPPPIRPERKDGLWRTTCFEMFVRPEGEHRYAEFNFSPSSAWAAYAFDAPRMGMRELPLGSGPTIGSSRTTAGMTLKVLLGRPAMISAPCSLGLSAVIEEESGIKSYWALTHLDPQMPDFHDPACFILELPSALPL